jgi:hypothetical protein
MNVRKRLAEDQYAGLICGSALAPFSPPQYVPPPAPLTPPDAFHGAPACVGTEALQRRAQLVVEAFIAAGPVAATIEKNL